MPKVKHEKNSIKVKCDCGEVIVVRLKDNEVVAEKFEKEEKESSFLDFLRGKENDEEDF